MRASSVLTFASHARPTHGMSRSRPIRAASVSLTASVFAAILLVIVAGTAAGQSALPVAQPTSTSNSASPANQIAAVSQLPSSKPQPKLEITYVAGNLTVDAANVSLNQVLREVAQKTGMKVSGGVSEESVFGHYGPLPAAELLATLLDGTGSNMLLVANKNGASELVLTPRRGGVTPPNPNAAMAANDNQTQPQEQYVPPIRPFQPPVALGRGPVGANPDGSPAFGPQNQNGLNPADGPKTPQQIYEQLQSLSPQSTGAPDQ